MSNLLTRRRLFCLPNCFQRNTFANATGATACAWCDQGYETAGDGNAACTPCSAGYYSPTVAAQSTTGTCVAAPLGAYVNREAATAFTAW